jgi:hypothetical protein
MQLYTFLLLTAIGFPATPRTELPLLASAAPSRVLLPRPTTPAAPPTVTPARVLSPTAAPAPPAAWPTQTRVTGTANLKATGMGIPYNNSFKLAYDLKIHIDPATGKASVDVSYQGHSSTIKGMLVNDSLIQLSIGQDVPQNFQGDGFSASLKGTIKNGFLSRINNKIRMFIHVDADGTILWQGLTIPVTGKVETDTHN